jgi:2-haloacid dehalogenase
MDFEHVQYIVFDTFGTVANWYDTVTGEGKALGRKYNFETDWGDFAMKWRGDGYIRIINDIVRGKRSWQPVDTIHLEELRTLLVEFRLPTIDEEDILKFNQVWHRLSPWPDAVAGLVRMKAKYRIGPFSNGDFKLLLDMAKSAKLPWDFITSADIFRKFKPDPTIYLDEVRFLGVVPEEIVFVSAHPSDMDGAKRAGYITALVRRPLEYGSKYCDFEPDGLLPWDIEASDFVELAQILGA